MNLSYSRRPIHSFSKAGFLGSLLISLGCATTDQNSKQDNIFDTSTENVVVQRIDDKTPIVSPFGKNYWLDARKDSSSGMRKIHGLLATGRAPEAEREARKFLSTHPGDTAALTALATALAQGGQYELAAYYARLIEKNVPNNPHSLNLRALSMLVSATRAEEIRAAAAVFKAAFDGSEAEIAAGLNLGNVYLEMGNSADAFATFEKVRNRCNDCIPALLGFGIAARRQGQFSEALTAFNAVIKINHDAEAMYHVALIYKDGLRNQKEAERTLREILALNTSRPSIKERAQTTLRTMLSEVSPGETAVVANSPDSDLDSLLDGDNKLGSTKSPEKSKKSTAPTQELNDTAGVTPNSESDDDFSTVSSSESDSQ